MKKSTSLAALTVTTAALVGLTAMPGYGDAIVNGGFESGSATNADNWNQLEIAAAPSTSIADRDLTMPNDGVAAMYLEVNGLDGGGGPVSEIQQQTLLGSITAGLTYDFSFLSKGSLGPGWNSSTAASARCKPTATPRPHFSSCRSALVSMTIG